MKNYFLFITILFVVIFFIFLLKSFAIIVYKHFIVKELDLKQRYGEGSWVMITGADSGQGKRYAIEFSKRGFNIILCGYASCNTVAEHIKQKYNIKTEVIECDFTNSWKKNFFVNFKKIFNKYDISILINNVGYRSGWESYENMPINEIRNTIAVGTMVQSVLTKLALKYFRKRHKLGLYKSAIINVTSQIAGCSLFPFQNPNYIKIPHLSVYESSNAYGFFHGNNIHNEYGDIYDILNITPGAVLTENTSFLQNTIGAISWKLFVRNCIKLLGNINGTTCGYWYHELLCLFIDFSHKTVFTTVGHSISNEFMKKFKQKM